MLHAISVCVSSIAFFGFCFHLCRVVLDGCAVLCFSHVRFGVTVRPWLGMASFHSGIPVQLGDGTGVSMFPFQLLDALEQRSGWSCCKHSS